MDLTKTEKMRTQLDLKQLLKKGYISDEVELERALILDRKLRLLNDEKPDIKELRKTLRTIIKSYEKINWKDENKITDEKIKESDYAEFIAEHERIFLFTRKDTIKKRLVEQGLNQQELGMILGHNKSYISELMNGIHPFNNKDLIIIHRLFDIKLELLIPTIIPQIDRSRIKLSISKIKIKNEKSRLKLQKVDLIMSSPGFI